MSQFDEDLHIFEILREIGHGSKVLCDIGARYQGSNSAMLIEKFAWTGVLVDKNQQAAEELAQRFPQCTVLNGEAKPESVNSIVSKDCRFLSIDVDSCDWWLWANLIHRPELVVIETNPLPGMYVKAMGLGEDGGYGCSVEAAKALGEMKGYDYLGRTVVNAFFARKDLGCKYRLPSQTEHRGSWSGTKGNVCVTTSS